MTPEQTKRFKYWQTRTIIATMVGYALFYFVRKNFSLAMPGLEADLGISKTSLGIFLTLNGVVYGLSRFVNGILADRMNARWYMAVGLALCALANFAFGFGEDISYWITGQHDGSQFTTPRDQGVGGCRVISTHGVCDGRVVGIQRVDLSEDLDAVGRSRDPGQLRRGESIGDLAQRGPRGGVVGDEVDGQGPQRGRAADGPSRSTARSGTTRPGRGVTR